MPTTFTLNQQPQTVQAPPEAPLLWVLRGELKLTGTKYGCGIAQCGACTVQLDGTPVRSCQLPVGGAAGRSISTIEGLAGPEIEALRAAWTELAVVQCGYCQSGQLVAAQALLKARPKPTDADIDAAMDGQLCRCGTYPRIRAAIHRAAEQLKPAGDAAAGAAPAARAAPAAPAASTTPATPPAAGASRPGTGG